MRAEITRKIKFGTISLSIIDCKYSPMIFQNLIKIVSIVLWWSQQVYNLNLIFVFVIVVGGTIFGFYRHLSLLSTSTRDVNYQHSLLPSC